MNIFIYWNYRDNNSKRIYGFLNSSNFIETIKQNNKVSLYREFLDFELDGKMLEDMQSSDLALFFTHGEKDAILKCNYTEDLLKKRYTLINTENIELLKNKIVIAICCYSAQQLGIYCTDQHHICETYIGFNEAIQYDDKISNVNFRTVMYEAYSKAFFEAFTYAYNSKCEVKDFVAKLKISLTQIITDDILKIPNRSLGSISQPIFFIKTTKSLVALGNNIIQLFV